MWNSHDSHSSIVQCRSSTVRMTDLSDGRVGVATAFSRSSSSIRRKDVVNEEEYCLKFLRVRLWCIWLSTIFVKRRQVVDFWVKKRSPVWKKLSYFFPAPFKFPRMIASTVISLVVYITAVLGSHNIGKARRGLLQLNLKIFWIFIFVIIGAASQWPKQVVYRHNQYRAQYDAPPVTWSKPRYSSALAHAKKCNFEHRYE